MPDGQHPPEHPPAVPARAARDVVFVGRAVEADVFRTALDGGPRGCAALYVHGPGGIGKSALLRRFAELAREAGRAVIEVDGRESAPSPTAFEAAVREAGPVDGRTVLIVDAFEHCRGLEHWLREGFLPGLPDGALVVIAGRRPPDALWTSDPGWFDTLRVTTLRTLGSDDAAALLTARGVRQDLHEPLLAYTGGHPLALSLAAEVALRDGRWTPSHDMVGTLLARLVDDVPSPAHRYALDVCAHARTTTPELLRAALPDEDTGTLYAWLEALPFVESGRYGLFPHDMVRDALDADLRRRDRPGYEAVHHRLRAQVAASARTATGHALLPAAGALTHLYRGGGITSTFFTFDGDGEVFEDTFRERDRSTLVALAAEAEGKESATLVDFWLDRRPEDFHVHRRSDTGRPVAFAAWLRLGTPREAELTADPVVAAAWAHARAEGPPREGEHLAIARFLVDPAAHQRPSAVMDLMLHRVLAGFLRQDRAAWTYLTWADAAFWQPLMAHFDHRPVPGEVTVGGRRHTLYGHDWRATALPAWLDLMGAEDIGCPSDEPAGPGPSGAAPGPGAPGRALPGEPAVLSREEFDTAVRDALGAWRTPGAFRDNPLIRSRLVADRTATGPSHAGPSHAGPSAAGPSATGPAVTGSGTAPDADADALTHAAAALREILNEAVDGLLDDPREARLAGVLSATYFRGIPTPEAVAARLGLPFSTYRGHLARALRCVTDRLWARELGDDDGR